MAVPGGGHAYRSHRSRDKFDLAAYETIGEPCADFDTSNPSFTKSAAAANSCQPSHLQTKEPSAMKQVSNLNSHGSQLFYISPEDVDAHTGSFFKLISEYKDSSSYHQHQLLQRKKMQAAP